VTDRQRNWLSIGLVAAIAGAASAYSVTEYRVGNLEAVVERIDDRVAEIYCAQVPEERRPGCR